MTGASDVRQREPGFESWAAVSNLEEYFQLRSSSSGLLFVPKGNTSIGTRALAVGAPTLWNVLPCCVKSIENIVKFHRHLKTHLYNLPIHHSSLAYQSI